MEGAPPPIDESIPPRSCVCCFTTQPSLSGWRISPSEPDKVICNGCAVYQSSQEYQRFGPVYNVFYLCVICGSNRTPWDMWAIFRLWPVCQLICGMCDGPLAGALHIEQPRIPHSSIDGPSKPITSDPPPRLIPFQVIIDPKPQLRPVSIASTLSPSPLPLSAGHCGRAPPHCLIQGNFTLWDFISETVNGTGGNEEADRPATPCSEARRDPLSRSHSPDIRRSVAERTRRLAIADLLNEDAKLSSGFDRVSLGFTECSTFSHSYSIRRSGDYSPYSLRAAVF
ncbi:hypothetical protein EIP86_011305 [Pleurotus ostreatoroseus]|nr:hypothetical protein EIP86_011305 [Pleurotus ostreatoroseus]